jgi:hypothetical protein
MLARTPYVYLRLVHGDIQEERCRDIYPAECRITIRDAGDEVVHQHAFTWPDPCAWARIAFVSDVGSGDRSV